MARLPVRDTSCSAGKQWYVCAKGNYHGCCSIDPCTTGVCPDDSTLTSMSTSSASSTLSSTSTSTSRTKTQTTQDVALVSTSTSATSLTFPTATSSATDTMSPTASSVVASAKSTGNNGMLIGGVVGGIVGVLLLLGLVLFLWCSRRKKPGQKVVAYPLVTLGLRSKRERRKRPGLVTDGRAMNRPRSNTKNMKSPSRPTPTRTSPTKTPTKPSPTKPSPTTPASPVVPASRLPPRQSPITPPSSGRSPTATTMHTARPVNTTSSASTPTISSLTLSEKSLLIHRTGTGLSTVSAKHLPPIPHHPALRTPPELPDTGFYRQRVELAACPSRELINKFDPRRQLCRPSETPDLEDVRLDGRGTAGARGPPRTGPVITADGVVLTANFERVSGEDEVLGTSGESGPAHVMSFMQYDPEWDEVLPAYHSSWRSGSLRLDKIEES